MLEYTSAALLISPQVSWVSGLPTTPSRSSHGGFGALGKLETVHEEPVKALPPLSEIQTPTSYREVAPEWNCATKEIVAVSPGKKQPLTTLRLVVEATRTSFVVHPRSCPEAACRHTWLVMVVPPAVGR
jgi:hypothetical protein